MLIKTMRDYGLAECLCENKPHDLPAALRRSRTKSDPMGILGEGLVGVKTVDTSYLSLIVERGFAQVMIKNGGCWMHDVI